MRKKKFWGCRSPYKLVAGGVIIAEGNKRAMRAMLRSMRELGLPTEDVSMITFDRDDLLGEQISSVVNNKGRF